MLYKVQWGKEANTQNGIYDIKGVLGQLEDCYYGECTAWEEEMWDSVHVGDWLEQIIKLEIGETVYVPYQGDGLMPEVLMITAVEGKTQEIR